MLAPQFYNTPSHQANDSQKKGQKNFTPQSLLPFHSSYPLCGPSTVVFNVIVR